MTFSLFFKQPTMNNNYNRKTVNVSKLIKDTNNFLKDMDRKNPKKGLFVVKKSYEWIEEAMQTPTPTMLFSELWHQGEVCILFADTNTGKSILAVQIADSISRGEAVEGFKLEAKAQPVVYFDFELYAKQYEARYSANYEHHYVWHPNLIRAELHPDMELPHGCDTFEDCLNMSLERVIEETDARVLVIDNLTYLRQETERAKDALPLMKELKALKNRYGLSILALAHTPKRDASKPITRNDLQGSKMLINFCDSSFCIGESHKDKAMRYIKQIKARNTEVLYGADNVLLCRIEKPHNFLRFTLIGTGSEAEHLRTVSEDDRVINMQRAKELQAEGMTQREIANTLEISLGVVNKYLKAS